jgi:hypothetical protein
LLQEQCRLVAFQRVQQGRVMNDNYNARPTTTRIPDQI